MPEEMKRIKLKTMEIPCSCRKRNFVLLHERTKKLCIIDIDIYLFKISEKSLTLGIFLRLEMIFCIPSVFSEYFSSVSRFRKQT